MTSQFYGTVAGINDHQNLALTEQNLQFEPPIGKSAPLNPHLLINTLTYLAPNVPYDKQQDINLGSLGGTNGVANALNNSNQVVGWSQTASGAQHAFVYSNGTMQDLNLLVPSSANITLIDAVGIDGSGRIVAFGTDASGQMDEFLLTPLQAPVPEPSTMAVFGLMIAAMAARHVRSSHSTKN